MKQHEKDELLAKFIGGKYWAYIIVDTGTRQGFKQRVYVDISELEMRKSLGYTFEYAFVADFNYVMIVANKIQKLGYSILVENDTVTINVKTNDSTSPVTSTTNKGSISGKDNKNLISTYYTTFYKFIMWYNDKSKEKKEINQATDKQV